MAISKITSDAIDATNFNLDSDTLTIDATNNRVGVGTASPAQELHVVGSSGQSRVLLESPAGQAGYYSFRNTGGSDTYLIGYDPSDGSLQFYDDVANTERMRIKSDGTLLIAQTADDSGVAGHIFNTNGSAFHVRDGGLVFVLNRLTDDGAIAAFRKDGTTVGSIKSRSGLVLSIVLDPRSNGSGLTGSTDKILPTNQTEPIDNTIDLGSSTTRFNDLYLGGGAYIGGTGSANKLDDYEEGTFDIRGSNTGYTLDSTYNEGRYTKIGNVVTCSIYIQLASATSGSTFRIDLPFTVLVNSGNSANSGVGAVMYNNFNVSTGMTDLVLYAAAGTSQARLFQSFDNAGWTNVSTNQLSGNESFYCTITYRTA